MKWMIAATVLALAANASARARSTNGADGQGGIPSAAVLQPSSKWTVDYQNNMCVLQRRYGEGEAAVIIGFRPIPLSDQVEVVLLRPAHDSQLHRKGTGSVALDGRAIIADYDSYHLAKTDQRVVTYYGDVGIDDVLNAPTATIAGDRSGPVTFAPHGSAGAHVAVDRCQDDLVGSWGVDVAMLKAAAKRAVPVTPTNRVFSPNDYPPQALRAGEEGRVLALMAVGADGLMTSCRAVRTATPLLDKATCDILRRRVHFTPAEDAEGRPIPTWTATAIRWVIP